MTGLVGRERELAMLTSCLELARTGRPQVVLCQGEPGVGKTRLARALVESARSEGVVAGWGTVSAVAGAPPYWCWWQALGRIGEVVDLQALARQQGLDRELSGLWDPKDQRGRALSPEDRFQLFDSVRRVLRMAARKAPLLLVLDDLHWADEASLLLLQHVGRMLDDERLMLLLTSRQQSPQDRVDGLGALLREPVLSHLELRGLDPAAVRRKLLEIDGLVVDEALADDVHRRTGGNPFFVGELARALAGSDQPGRVPVTAGARAAITERLRRLTPVGAELVRAAAVLGPEGSTLDLAALVGVDPIAATESLAALRGAALLEPADESGRWRFAHAIVRDAVLAELPPGDRVELHRRAADQLEARHAGVLGSHVFDIAQHHAESAAGDGVLVAAGWLERAADRALSQLAFEDAVILLRRALVLADAMIEPAERVRLLLRIGAVGNLSGDLGERLNACLDAADIARELGRPELLAEAALVMEVTATAPGFEVVTRRLCQEALRELGPEPTALRARLLARVVETYVFSRELEHVASLSAEALQIATGCADAAALAAAMSARRLVCAGPQGLAEREYLAGRMLALAKREGDAAVELAAHLWQIDVSFERGDLPRVAEEIEALAHCAADLGRLTAGFEVTRCRAVLAQAQGRYADAQRLEAEAFAMIDPVGLDVGAVLRSGLLPLIGRHLGPDPRSTEANALIADDPEALASIGLIAQLSAAHGSEVSGQRAEAERGYRACGPVEGWRPPPHVVLLVDALGIAVADALDDTADLAVLRRRLGEHRGHHVVSGTAQVAYFGPVELWLGLAAHRCGQLTEAITDLEQAEADCARAGAAGFRVEAQLRLAAALAERRGQDDLSRAATLLGQAASACRRLGMTPYVARTAAIQAQVDRLAGVVALSPREAEVARLVGQGLTNREVAGRLVLSERTIEHHVGSVLAKLGLTNRAQVAAWASRQIEYKD